MDVLLQANPAERRLIFEEAAGISRYKARKKEAERKLERVEQNLLRARGHRRGGREAPAQHQVPGRQGPQLPGIRPPAPREAGDVLAGRVPPADRAAQRPRAGRRPAWSDEVTAAADGDQLGRGPRVGAGSRSARARRRVRQIEQQILTNASEITANRERIEQSRQRIEELVDGPRRGPSSGSRPSGSGRPGCGSRSRPSRSSRLGWRPSCQRRPERAVDALTGEDRELAEQLTALQARSEDEKAGIIDLMRRTAQLNNEISSLGQRRQQLEDEKARLQCPPASRSRAELDGAARGPRRDRRPGRARSPS